MNKKTGIIVLLIVAFHGYFAQDLQVDVWQLIKGKTPEKKMAVLDSLAVASRKKDPGQVLAYDRMSINIAKENRLYQKLVQAYIGISKTYRNLALYDSALFFCDSAILTAEAHDLKEAMAMAHDQKGVLYTRIASYDKAMASFERSLAYQDKLAEPTIVINIYNHIGNLFFYQKNYYKAKEYYHKSLAFIPEHSDQLQYASAVDNIGLCFLNMSMFDSALFYQKKGVVILEKLNKPSVLAESYNNIAATFIQLKRYQEAENMLHKALLIAEKTKDNYIFVNTSITLGQTYIKQGRIMEASVVLDSAYKKAKSGRFLYQSKEAALFLARAYTELGQYKKAAPYFDSAAQISDSIYKHENREFANELSVKYETREKLQKIELLTKDNEIAAQKAIQNRYLTYLISLLAVFLFATGVFFFSRFRRKKKDHALLLLKNKDIARQNELIEAQKEELTHKNKEITDSIHYALIIQKSVLPSSALLKQLLGKSFIYYKPKDIVSGDFYWLSHQGPYIYVVVADCTGHGVPGAIMSMLGMSGLNQIISEKEHPLPSEILLQMHRQVLHILHEDVDKRTLQDGMDMAVLRIDSARKTFTYAGAGRPLYYLEGTGLQVIAPDKISIGSVIGNDVVFRDHTIGYEQGCKVFLFSDGVQDQFGGKDGKKFKSRIFKQFLSDHAHQDINYIEKEFIRVFEDWSTGYEQTDDVTVFGAHLS